MEWWTQVVRDLDLVDQMDKVSAAPNPPGSRLWVQTMDRVVAQSLKATDNINDDMDSKAAAAFAAANGDRWVQRYKGVMEDVETIRGLLPWSDEATVDVEESYGGVLEWLGKQPGLGDETPVLKFDDGVREGAKEGEKEEVVSYLFVAPRYFRGIGLAEELVSTTYSIYYPYFNYNWLSYYYTNILYLSFI